MNMFKREFRAHLKPLVIWTLAMLFYIVAAMMKYDATLASGDSMMKLVESMPAIVKSMLGIGVFDLNSPIGFFGASYIYLMLFGAIHGGMLGATVLAAEERDKTSEFLMVRPVTRNRVASAKIGASLVLIGIFNVVVYLGSVLVLNGYGEGTTYFGECLRLSAGFLGAELFFFSLGFFLSCLLKNPRRAASLTTAALMAALIFTTFGDYLEQLRILRYFSPFSYFDPKVLLGFADPNIGMLLLGFLLPPALLALSYVFYNRRDLNL